MREEELKILKMLEEGKITAEEAERLLSALKGRTKETKHQEPDIPEGVNVASFTGKLVSSMLGMVPGVVFSALKGGIAEVDETIPADDIKEINITVSAGDLDIRTSEDSMIRIKGKGSVNIKRVDNVLEASIPAGDFHIEIPEHVLLYARVNAGDISMKDVAFPVKIEMQAGDIDISYKKVKDLYIDGMAGDVRVMVPEDSSFKFDYDVSMGSFRLPRELKGGKFPIIWGNSPEAEFKIRLTAGDLKFVFIGEKEE